MIFHITTRSYTFLWSKWKMDKIEEFLETARFSKSLSHWQASDINHFSGYKVHNSNIYMSVMARDCEAVIPVSVSFWRL